MILFFISEKKFEIPSCNILGHSDIAPLRKIDPGKHFPWEKLYKRKIGMKVKETGEIGKSLTSNDHKLFFKKTSKKLDIQVLCTIPVVQKTIKS